MIIKIIKSLLEVDSQTLNNVDTSFIKNEKYALPHYILKKAAVKQVNNRLLNKN